MCGFAAGADVFHDFLCLYGKEKGRTVCCPSRAKSGGLAVQAFEAGGNRFGGNGGNCLIARGLVQHLHHIVAGQLVGCFFGSAAANLVFPFRLFFGTHRQRGQTPFAAFVQFRTALAFYRHFDDAAAHTCAAAQTAERRVRIISAAAQQRRYRSNGNNLFHIHSHPLPQGRLKRPAKSLQTRIIP